MLWLRKKRKEYRMTQLEIANKAEISLSFYSLIENNLRRPSPDVAKRIANVLGFPDEWFRLLDQKPDALPSKKKKRRQSTATSTKKGGVRRGK